MTDVEAVPKRRVSEESRRSTRVRLKLVIEAHGIGEPLKFEGVTFVVNLHGALILTAIPLRVGMKISIHVYVTDKRATARSCTSIQTSRDTAELNWRSLRTFGACLCLRMIGMRVTRPSIVDVKLLLRS